MNQIEQNCWECWSTLKSTIQLIKMKEAAGMSTANDKVHAAQLLEELRMYYDTDLMPAEMKKGMGRQGRREAGTAFSLKAVM